MPCKALLFWLNSFADPDEKTDVYMDKIHNFSIMFIYLMFDFSDLYVVNKDNYFE